MDVFRSLTTPRASLPRLSLAQRVVDKMVRNAMIYETETGESLVGFAIKVRGRLEPDLYVIDTIAPDESAIRRGAYFEQGDDLQGDIFSWWSDNWNEYRKRRRGSYGNAVGAKWDEPLKHLGDWHKHPGTLIEPSWGDSDTARKHIADEETETPQLLAILATVWGKQHAEAYDQPAPGDASQTADAEPGPLKIAIDEHTVVRLDPWYMSRNTRRFVRLAASIAPDKMLPTLPIVGWHLSQPERARQEIDTLQHAGYSVSMEQYDADGQPPLEICFPVAKLSSPNLIIVVTEADYPEKMPTVRLVPMASIKDLPEGGDMFLNLWAHSEPLAQDAYPTWSWTANHTLLDLVRAVEERSVVG